MFLLALLASLFVLTLALIARGTHVTCTWTGPGPKDPKQYGYSLWCAGSQVVKDIYNASSNSYFKRVQYLCKDQGNIKVADWDYLASKVSIAASSIRSPKSCG